MKSPFPGMDPFLEEPARWSSVHTRLINALSDQLAEQIAPHFFVEIEQRVYITTPDDPARRPIIPDVYVTTGQKTGQPLSATAGTIAEPTLIEPIYDLEMRDRYIEILDAQNHEVITTLEILSPFNKRRGTPGHEAFLNKRKTVLASKVHWLEIDLLRAGERPPEVSDRSDYYALLKRGEITGPFAVWFIDLREPLPVIAVPLRPPFADVPLDLQAAFDLIYARAHYADSLDYDRAIPAPPLPPADERWVREQVRQWQSLGKEIG
jgi:hypothetical protein